VIRSPAGCRPSATRRTRVTWTSTSVTSSRVITKRWTKSRNISCAKGDVRVCSSDRLAVFSLRNVFFFCDCSTTQHLAGARLLLLLLLRTDADSFWKIATRRRSKEKRAPMQQGREGCVSSVSVYTTVRRSVCRKPTPNTQQQKKGEKECVQK
jgi:hypothetical protein